MWSEGYGRLQEFKPPADLKKLLSLIGSQEISLSALLPLLVEFLLSYKEFRTNKIDRSGYLYFVVSYLQKQGLNVQFDLDKLLSSDAIKKINNLMRSHVRGWSLRNTYELLKRFYKERGYDVSIVQDKSGKWIMKVKEGGKKEREEKEKKEEKEKEKKEEKREAQEMGSVGDKELVRERKEDKKTEEKWYDFTVKEFRFEFYRPLKEVNIEVKDLGLKSSELKDISMPKIIRRPRR